VFLRISALNQLCLAFTFGSYVLFLRSLGLSPLEVNLVNVAFFMGRFLLEVPTGVIADRYGRKVSCVIAFALYAAGTAFYWCATSFWMCVTAELILAVGSTCLSGAFDAWIRYEMQHEGSADVDLHRVMARNASYDQIALIVGAPLGGIGSWYFGLATPWLMTAVGMSVVTYCAAVQMRESRVRVVASHGYAAMMATAVGGMRYAMTHSRVRIFLGITILMNLGLMVPNMQWAPTFAPYVGEGLGTGFVFAGIAIALWLGSRLAPRLLLRTRNEFFALAIALLGIASGLGCIGLLSFPLSLGSFGLYEFAYGVLKPLRRAAMNNAIDSDDHATVLSCDEMLGKLAGGIGLVVTGALVQYVSPQFAWFFAGICCLAAGYVAYRNRH
jgi:MFS family permease